MHSRTVALVGRPNVGKSRLFNRLARRRLAIVHDMPGVTRDVMTAEVRDGQYFLMDTGGIGMTPEATPEVIQEAATQQVDFALETATVVVFVVDGRAGLTPLDVSLAERLRRLKKQVVVAVNKLDHEEMDDATAEFYKLGLGGPIPVSAEHGRGVDELEAAMFEALGPPPEEDFEPEDRRIKIALIGRPNVGKSSLGNRLLNAERLIVSDVAGTTRDAVEMDLDYQPKRGPGPWRFRLVDTAGIRAKMKVKTAVEYYSTVRSRRAVERADVVFLLPDAIEGVARPGPKLGGGAPGGRRAPHPPVNKWDQVIDRFRDDPPDGYRNERDFRAHYAEAVRKELFFAPKPPVLFVSAHTGLEVEALLAQARGVDATLDMPLPTGPLNRLLQNMMEARSPARAHGKRFKLFYCTLVEHRPFTIRIFCNDPKVLDDPYRRYLQNGIIDHFELQGCPVHFEMRGKERRFTSPESSSPPDHS